MLLQHVAESVESLSRSLGQVHRPKPCVYMADVLEFEVLELVLCFEKDSPRLE